MKILLVGGSKSGKSHLAQRISKGLACGGRLIYWATMEPVDEEDRLRIKKHLIDRCGWGFETVECGKNLSLAADNVRGASCVLFDSLTAVLANEMFCPEKGFDKTAPDRVVSELSMLSDCPANIVFVCDDIFRDGKEYDEWTEAYMKGLALICRSAANTCDIVAEVVSGIAVVHKGAEEFVRIMK